jgi:GT2 family glycosyltransferase
MKRERTVAVVIPSWNSLALLPRCLGSLRDQGVELETLVVDNGSEDGTVAYLERKGVAHLALPENLGFARAVNLGAARVKSEAVLALNADTVVEPGAVAALLEALEADAGLGGVQPRILQLEEAGRDAERYFAFYEDVDLNVRARIAGWRFAYVPEATVWHLGNASWMAAAPRPGAWNARLVARNRIATQAKFMPPRALPRIFLVEVGALARAARQGRFRATLRGKLEGLRRLPAMLRDRRRLAREGDLGQPRHWLGRVGL